jgi:hypothetical protein
MKDWSAEQASAEQAAYVAAGGNSNDPSGPLYQWAALQKIDALETAYNGGDTLALLDAVAQCARCELVMPEWVIRGFLDRFRAVRQFKVRTLDEAFGSVLPKGAKLPAHRAAWKLELVVYLKVTDRHEAGEPIDEGLFESVGEDFGISGSTVRDYYYRQKKKWYILENQVTYK